MKTKIILILTISILSLGVKANIFVPQFPPYIESIYFDKNGKTTIKIIHYFNNANFDYRKLDSIRFDSIIIKTKLSTSKVKQFEQPVGCSNISRDTLTIHESNLTNPIILDRSNDTLKVIYYTSRYSDNTIKEISFTFMVFGNKGVRYVKNGEGVIETYLYGPDLEYFHPPCLYNICGSDYIRQKGYIDGSTVKYTSVKGFLEGQLFINNKIISKGYISINNSISSCVKYKIENGYFFIENYSMFWKPIAVEYYDTTKISKGDSVYYCHYELEKDSGIYIKEDTVNYLNLYIKSKIRESSKVGNLEYNINEIELPNLTLSVSPNPFNNETTFYYNIPEGINYKKAIINISNVQGVKLKQIELKDKKNAVKWNAEALSSGLYFYQLIIGDKIIKTGNLIRN